MNYLQVHVHFMILITHSKDLSSLFVQIKNEAVDITMKTKTATCPATKLNKDSNEE